MKAYYFNEYLKNRENTLTNRYEFLEERLNQNDLDLINFLKEFNPFMYEQIMESIRKIRLNYWLNELKGE